uniref:Uncharacterized protein n=1 Tax=Anguilla anguilla TaxID=7936 RepID=A0A0E9S1Q1_ANGAN
MCRVAEKKAALKRYKISKLMNPPPPTTLLKMHGKL